MKILSKVLCMLLCISMVVGILASCDIKVSGDDDAYIEELDVNKKGELIVIFSDGEEENFGVFSPDGEEDGIVDIAVSKKGKMTLEMANGKSKTVGYTYTDENEDDDEVIVSVEINEDGELIVTRADESEENLGKVRDNETLGGECIAHVDADRNGKCDVCGETLQVECTKHVDANKDGECDNCGASVQTNCTNHVDANKDGYCDECGEPFTCTVHVDADRNGKCDKCDEPLICTSHVDANRNGKCDKCDADVEIPWWDAITYDQTSLIFQMTHCSNGEELSSGCERYLAGEDHQARDIDDLIAQRNDDAYELTRVTVRYYYYDDIAGEYGWGKNYNKICMDVASQHSGAPDMYCNFVADLVAASLKGSFANLYSRTRGDGDQRGVNFLDIDAPGYMGDLMSSLTLSLDKIYVIASDYFLDLVRAFYVVPVNRYLFDNIANEMIADLNGDGVTDINDFYEEIYNGDWTYERLAQYAGKVYQNTSYVSSGMDLQDTLGFMLTANGMHGAGLIYTSSVTIIHKEWNTDRGDYDYYYPDENAELYYLADAIDELFNQVGVYYLPSSECTEPTVIQQVRKQFSTDKLLFGGITMLGSMEHYQYQQMNDNEYGGFGVAPVPVYKYGDKYLTQIHAMGRAGAISDATTKFAQCSAFIQYQSTHSEDVLNEYFDLVFTSEYYDTFDGNVEMLEYIRSNVRTSFDRVFEDVIGFFYETTQPELYRNRWHNILVDSQYHLTYMREQYKNLYPSKRSYMVYLVSDYDYDVLPD